jgi:hypothetical protein
MIVWTHNVCEELNLRRHHETVSYQDNQSTIKVIIATKGNYKINYVDLKCNASCVPCAPGLVVAQVLPATNSQHLLASRNNCCSLRRGTVSLDVPPIYSLSYFVFEARTNPKALVTAPLS